ncbi:MAG: hypothetical protein AB1810_00370 [Pseudomonadota bacterium]
MAIADGQATSICGRPQRVAVGDKFELVLSLELPQAGGYIFSGHQVFLVWQRRVVENSPRDG